MQVLFQPSLDQTLSTDYMCHMLCAMQGHLSEIFILNQPTVMCGGVDLGKPWLFNVDKSILIDLVLNLT